MLPLYYYCLTLIGFLCCCQAAPTVVNGDEVYEPPFEKVDASNATLLRVGTGPLHCNKKGYVQQQDKDNIVRALDEHYNRGQWGTQCYSYGVCVDARNLMNWNSPKDCMNELRGRLRECLDKNALDGYTEQAVWGAKCMMHYWLDGV